MPATKNPSLIAVPAPDGYAAHALERRLAPFGETSVGYGAGWKLELEPSAPVEAVLAQLAYWLCDTGRASVEIEVDGSPLTVAAAPAGR